MSTGKLAFLCFSIVVVMSLILGLANQYHLDFLQAPCWLILSAACFGLIMCFVRVING